MTRLGQHTWIWPSLLQHQAALPLSSRPLVLRLGASQMALVVKILSANAGDTRDKRSILG